MHEITTDQNIPPAQNVVSTELEPGQEEYDVRKTDEVPAQNVVSTELEPGQEEYDVRKTEVPAQTLISTEPASARTGIHWSWGDLLLIFFVSIAFFLVVAVILAVVFVVVLRNAALYEGSALLLEAVALVGGVYLLGLRRRRHSWAAIGIRSTSRRWLLGAIGLGLLLVLVMGLVANGMQVLLRQPGVNPQQNLFLPNGLSWVSIIGTILFGGVAVPFAEELFFRGVLYTFLRERWGVWIGAVVSAMLFGAAHLNISVGVAVFILGLVSALVYERTKSLWPSIIIHVVNNSFKFILVYALLAATTRILLF